MKNTEILPKGSQSLFVGQLLLRYLSGVSNAHLFCSLRGVTESHGIIGVVLITGEGKKAALNYVVDRKHTEASKESSKDNQTDPSLCGVLFNLEQERQHS